MALKRALGRTKRVSHMWDASVGLETRFHVSVWKHAWYGTKSHVSYNIGPNEWIPYPALD